ncbi:MAG: hypothetical protein LLF76_02335 [Planctomycetaceae bacterium]|nr:hypothetical protein [Planctomycetaceae bacterium]
MESVTIPQSLMYMVVLISIIVQFIREFTQLEKYKRFIPYACILMGIAGSFFGVGFPDCIMVGVAIGLMSAGGYDAITAFSAKKIAEAAKAAVPFILIALVLFVAGCPNPLFTQEQQLLLQQAEPIVTELDTRCQAGDQQACTDGLHQAAITLQALTQAP